jgi:hypothetical protein
MSSILVHTIQRTIGVINQVFKPSLVQQHTRLNIYRTLARPVLIGSEAWTIRKTDENRLQVAEMKFMKKTAGFTLWDHKRTEEILKNLKVEPISVFIQDYRANCKEHIEIKHRSASPSNGLCKFYPSVFQPDVQLSCFMKIVQGW